MKINEIINEGLLGWAARELDRLGGGTGNIGGEKRRQMQSNKDLAGEANRLYKAFLEILRSQGTNPLDPDKKDSVASTARKAALAYGNSVVGLNGKENFEKFINKADEIFNQPVTNQNLQNYFNSTVRVAQELTNLTPKLTAAQLNQPTMIYRITDSRSGRTFFKSGAGTNWYEYFGANWPGDLQTSQKISDDKTLNFINQAVAAGGVSAEPAPKTTKK